MHLAAVGRAERLQPRVPSLGSVPLTCRCSRAPWTLLQPPTQGAPGGWAGLGLLRSQERSRWRLAEVLVVRLGAHLASLRPDGAPVHGRSPGQAAVAALEAHEPFAARESTTFWIAGPRVHLVPFTWNSSQQGLAREGCLRGGPGLAPLHPALHHPPGMWPRSWTVTLRTCSDQGPKMEEADLTPSASPGGPTGSWAGPMPPRGAGHTDVLHGL